MTTQWLDFNSSDNQSDTRKTEPRISRETIRDHLLARLPELLAYLYPQGQIRGQQFFIGNLRGDKGKSLVVTLDGPEKGLWQDFATDEGGDVFDLWAAFQQLDTRQHFPQVIKTASEWLGIASVLPLPTPSPKPAHDDLGPPTAKWDYLNQQGRLMACVYRYDTPEGKVFRPWDVLAKKHRAPLPRPLFNQPGLATSHHVVLVEGEKAAAALIAHNIPATTAMNGANAAPDKTDWSPLKDKHILIWPDHDQAGRDYAHTVGNYLSDKGIVASLSILTIPEDKPEKWDAFDAVEEGMDIISFIQSATPPAPIQPDWNFSKWHACERFVGKPKQRKWLIEGVFPLAQPLLIAAAGGVGKSFLLLELARETAHINQHSLYAPTLFGGRLETNGTSVYITAEDDVIEVHNRLSALGDIPPNLYVVPLPDAGGAQPLFSIDAVTRTSAVTPQWHKLTTQLFQMRTLRVVIIDPLQPLCALDLNMPENVQFVCSQLSWLAATTGASVVISHHFAKKEVLSPEQARDAIRGSGGLVDGVRSCYAFWHPKVDKALSVCKSLAIKLQRGNVVMGGVVKANGRSNLNISTFVRDENKGILVDQTLNLMKKTSPEDQLFSALIDAIAQGAEAGKPYTKTGLNGVYERRFEMPESFHGVGKHRLTAWVEQLLSEGQLVAAMAQGSTSVKWLDIPHGPVAQGGATFQLGHLRRNTA